MTAQFIGQYSTKPTGWVLLILFNNKNSYHHQYLEYSKSPKQPIEFSTFFNPLSEEIEAQV